jgi:hypothetical protein
VLLRTHRACVVTVLLKIRLELGVLLLDEVLADIGEASEGDNSAKVAHAGREVEGDLALSDKAAAPVRDQVREDVVANEAAQLSKSCCDAVVLPTY